MTAFHPKGDITTSYQDFRGQTHQQRGTAMAAGSGGHGRPMRNGWKLSKNAFLTYAAAKKRLFIRPENRKRFSNCFACSFKGDSTGHQRTLTRKPNAVASKYGWLLAHEERFIAEEIGERGQITLAKVENFALGVPAYALLIEFALQMPANDRRSSVPYDWRQHMEKRLVILMPVL